MDQLSPKALHLDASESTVARFAYTRSLTGASIDQGRFC